MRDFRTIVGMALVAAATAFPAGASATECTHAYVNGTGEEVCYEPVYTGPVSCVFTHQEPLDVHVCVPQGPPR